MMRPVLGGPGVSDEAIFSRKFVFRDGKFDPLPGGGYINSTKSRNPFATEVQVLEAGLLMGQVTTTSLWAPTFIGASTAAITGTGTTLTVSAAAATEVVRRIGTSGTLKLLGPPAANGTARQVTVTYSAVNTTTGEITITALGTNAVQTITFNAAATGGTYVFRVPKVDGTFVNVPVAWNGTDATLLSNINTALDAATTVTGGIVATGAAPDTALTFTFSGTGYAALPQPLIEVVGYPTTPASYTIANTATGVAGAFAAGSLISDTDGSETPKSCIPPGYGIMVADGANQPTMEPFPVIPISGIIAMEQLTPVVTDLGIRAWIKDYLSSTRGGKFIFTDSYGPVGG